MAGPPIPPPLFSPNVPRFAPPRTHTRTPSRSPTRHRLADDILSDLSPATTLEAFTSPSGKFKASIEAATPSERAFGLRATLASKKIQEWVDELSAWPWPAEGGSSGFEIPSAKRRKLSLQIADRGRRNSNGYTQEPIYIGSLLEAEVDRYENRIDDITADMEDLNVEEIKRQVLDTHFSPRSRPSSSASNAPPIPSLFASYTRMDDFTAVITATVLHSLPNLSRLTRLMDVWNIRLSVLRKVPPLMTALDDAEIALKSGWTAIETPQTSPNPSSTGDPHLSRKTFEIMRNVLQDKVTNLGQDLDYMLDTLEGREDTLPDMWLDRMQAIENNYGSWAVSGDGKVREEEWAGMARARKEEDDAWKLKEAEAAETARRKAEEEALRKARLDAGNAEAAKAEQEAQEAARLQAEEAAAVAWQKSDDDARDEAARLEALQRAEELEAARLLVVQQAEAEATRLKAEQEAAEAAKLKALHEAEEHEASRLLAEQRAESARLLAEEEARNLARQNVLNEAKEARDARLRAGNQAEDARLPAENQVRDLTKQKALDETAQAEAARLLAEQQALESVRVQAEELGTTQQQALGDARVKAGLETQDVDRQALKKVESFETARLLAQQLAVDAARRQHTADLTTLQANRDAEGDATRKAELEAEIAESHRRDEEIEFARQNAEQEAKYARKQAQTDVATAALKSKEDAEDPGLARQAEIARTMELSEQAEHDAKISITSVQQDMPVAESARMNPTSMDMTDDESTNVGITDCDVCEEIRISQPNSPLQPGIGAAVGSGAVRTQNLVDSLTPDEAINPQITRYAPFDGGYEFSGPAIRTTEVEIKKGASGPDLASPIHLDDSFLQTPTSSNVSSSAGVFASPTSKNSSSTRSKGMSFRHGFASVVLGPSPQARQDRPVPKAEESHQIIKIVTPAPQTPMRSVFSFDGANDFDDFDPTKSQKPTDQEWIAADSPESSNIELPVDLHHSNPESSNSRSSVVFDYSTSEPTPEIHEVEPAEYFASPAKSTQPYAEIAGFKPSGSLPVTPKPLPMSSIHSATPSNASMPLSNRHSRESTNPILSPVAEEFIARCTELGVDGSCDGCEIAVRDLESDAKDVKETELPVLARKKISISQTDSPIRRIATPRRESISSDASTIIHGRVIGSPSSTAASPISEDTIESSIEQSPSAGRIGHRSVKSYDISPPNSPPGVAKRPSLFLPSTPSFSSSTAPSTPLAESAPPTPLDAPVFSNVDVSTIPIMTSPQKANSDDQMQQQISSLLESIPARIRLTTESDSTSFTSDALRPKKTRRSMRPSYRSSSSMSNYSTLARAPTPSFTLTPAFGKTSSRTRPQSSNPEIKLYHLSRSTGEAPIKLFVRLVGEHGERVMVRVGGGWADLGEYLKEYASHHGRRSAVDAGDIVQIQDLPSRNVSSLSTATLRGIGSGSGSGRLTPDTRPQSVTERQRPGSSLFVRKTRRSGGDSTSSSSSDTTTSASASVPSLTARPPDAQSRPPSTPLPSPSSLHRTNNSNDIATPPSVSSSTSTSTQDRERDRPNRPSSCLSRTSEDTSLALGLAGPKSKNITISERDQEWVESMKEKVRMASAEKERRGRDSGVGLGTGTGMGLGVRGKGESGGRESLGGRESGRESRSSFGEMEKVGGTKRLFMKGM